MTTPLPCAHFFCTLKTSESHFRHTLHPLQCGLDLWTVTKHFILSSEEDQLQSKFDEIGG